MPTVTIRSAHADTIVPSNSLALGFCAAERIYRGRVRGGDLPAALCVTDDVDALDDDLREAACAVASLTGERAFVLLVGEGVGGCDVWVDADVATGQSVLVDGWHKLHVPGFVGEVSVLVEGGVPVRASQVTDTCDDAACPDEDVLDAAERLTGRWHRIPDEWDAANDRNDGRAEAVATLDSCNDQPTHRLTFVPADGGAPQVEFVRLVAEPGPAYGRREWLYEQSACWEVTTSGRWFHQGQVTPGGANGTVTVERLPPVAETVRLITIHDPNGRCVTGGHCVARFRADGDVSIEGECPDEAGGCPSGEIEECLADEAARPVGHVVHCHTTRGIWNVYLGAVAAT